jgi:putative glutamine amidotransferase
VTTAVSAVQPRKPGRPRIGITPDIEWRNQPSPARAHYVLDAQLVQALESFGALAFMLPHHESAIDELLTPIDGLVLSGGEWQFPHRHLLCGDGSEPPHKARRARFELALARAALDRDIPLLGICGGFQILNEIAGGELVVSLAAERATWQRHAAGSYVEQPHDVMPVVGSHYATIAMNRRFAVNSRHRQGVTAVGPLARVAALSDDGLVEAIELADKRFAVGTQWHPEFLLNEPDRRLLNAFVSASMATRAHSEQA